MATRKRSSVGFSSSAGRGPGLGLWLALAAVVVLIDQFSKVLIVGSLQYGDSHTVTSFFNIVRWHNTGAAFSFLAGAAGWQRWFFVALAVSACGFILWLLRKHAGQRLFCFAITMVLGGAVGNLIDRLWHGYVVDFIQVHHGAWVFPAFNLADSAITLGAVCLVVDELRRVRRG